MRVLEARFHPRSKKEPQTVRVGRVLCSERSATIELAQLAHGAIAPFDPSSLKARLRFLVKTARPHFHDELLSLHSDYWEFVEVPLNEA